ncbi:MAG: hypothetical protein JSW54_04620 [Fidelibacterota bacterium]|nr:MAG: hypothetical protein JSW54_04620 [Candidatus Neomarinimicrobiota bacterium]
MNATIVLTDEQRRKVLEDADGKVEMLSPEEVEDLATKLNRAIDIPLVKLEKKEQIIFVKLVKQIDRFIYKVLPNEIYELIKRSTDGIDKADAELIKERLIEIVDSHVNIPLVKKEKEKEIFTFVIGLICDALLAGAKV